MKKEERWKMVLRRPFTEYWVSDAGRCKRVDVRTGEETLSYGYLNRFTRYRQFARTSVHRLVAEAFLEKPEGAQQVDHLNDDREDNRACNLEWTTARQNAGKPSANARRRANRRSRNRDGQAIRAVKDGKTKYFRTGYAAARFIGCSHVLIYNCLNKRGSARLAMGWSLEWTDMPEGGAL